MLPRLLLAIVAITLRPCPRVGPTIACNQPKTFTVPAGACRSFTNPCGTHFWEPGDLFRLTGNAPGFSAQKVNGEWQICVAAGLGPRTTTLDFRYYLSDANADRYGEGRLEVEVITALVATAAANPSRIRPGDSAFLTGDATGGVPPYSYAWDPGYGLSAEVRNPFASPEVDTTYTLTVTDATGQTAQSQVTVFVDFGVTVIANPARVDPGQQAVLMPRVLGGQSPYRIAWTPVAGLDNAANAEPIATPGFTTTYTIAVTDALGEVASASVTLIVNPQASPVANPASIAQGATAQLSANAAGGAPPYTYAWSPATGLSSTTIANPVAGPAATTRYTVTVTDAIGGQTSAQVEVTVAAASGPVASFTVAWLDLNSVRADASGSTGNIVRYEWWEFWLADNSPPDQTTTVPSLTWFADPGATVRLRVTDLAGRQDVATRAIPVH